MGLGLLVLTLWMLGWKMAEAWSCNTSLEELYPQWDSGAYSCEGRCGDPHSALPCACDWRCALYGDCCQDMTALCGDTPNHSEDDHLQVLTSTPDDLRNDSSSQLMPSSLPDFFPDASPFSLRKSLPLNRQPASRSLPKMSLCVGKSQLISVCPTPVSLPQETVEYGGRQIEARELLEKCQTPWQQTSPSDPLQLLPVSDKGSGHHFLNIFCFLCHGGRVSQSVPWTFTWAWRAEPENSLTSGPKSVFELMEAAKRSNIPAVAFPPASVTARRCGLPSENVSSVSCHCPDLMDRCAHSAAAYIVANYQLYHHPSCLLCAFLRVSRRPDLMKVPDMPRWTWSFSSVFYPLNVSWSSDPASTSDNATLTIAYDPKPGRNLFAWERMECDVRSNRADEKQGTGLQDSASEHASPDSHQGSRNTDNEDSEITNQNSHAQRASGLHCRHTKCKGGVLEVDGACNSAATLSLFLSVHMSCMTQASEKKDDPLIPLSLALGPKTKLVQSSPFTQRQLTEDLQQRLHGLVDKVVVSNPNVCWDENRCYWLITAEATFPRGRMEEASVKDESLASTMYSATTSVLSQQLTQLKHGLLVCVRVESHGVQAEEEESGGGGGVPCAYRTVLGPVADVGNTAWSSLVEKSFACYMMMFLCGVLLFTLD